MWIEGDQAVDIERDGARCPTRSPSSMRKRSRGIDVRTCFVFYKRARLLEKNGSTVGVAGYDGGPSRASTSWAIRPPPSNRPADFSQRTPPPRYVPRAFDRLHCEGYDVLSVRVWRPRRGIRTRAVERAEPCRVVGVVSDAMQAAGRQARQPASSRRHVPRNLIQSRPL